MHDSSGFEEISAAKKFSNWEKRLRERLDNKNSKKHKETCAKNRRNRKKKSR